MWKIIKYEIKYNWYYFFMLIILFLAYSVMSLTDFQLTTTPDYKFDYWEDIYGIILFSFLISIWGTRLKEKRIRNHELLPLPQKQISLTRFWFVTLPLLAIINYIIIVQLIFIENWHKESGELIGQMGVCFILFAGFIRGRDDWFSYWDFGKRTSSAFVAILLIQIVIVFVFVEMESFNKGVANLYGLEAFHYAKLIFPLLALIILLTTIFSYRSRRTYLS